MEVEKGVVESLAFGGHGIVRKEGFVFFVPFTAPGDVVSFRITKKKSSYALGEVVRIHELSPKRAVPLCSYFGTCGGCQLQHLIYSEQLEHKRQCVEGALKRIGHLNVEVSPVVPAVKHWAYRRHVHLNLRQEGMNFKAGYIAVDNRSLVQVNSCPIFIEEGDQVLEQLQEVCRNLLSGAKNDGRVTILKQTAQSYLLHFHFKLKPSNTEEVLVKALETWPAWSGVVVSTPGNQWTAGNIECMMELDDLKFTFSPRAFIQNHPEQSLNIYRTICQIVKSREARNIVDLYCGIGCSTLFLAKQCEKIIGIENNSEAVHLAKENAALNGLTNAEFICADVKDVFEKDLIKLKADLIVMNPPREGIDSVVIKHLLKMLPKELIYISCMPSTLARDLKLLSEGGYQIKACLPFDMFPQTAHVETVVHLVAL